MTIETILWANCYGDSWRDFITPKSFAHPAKMARGLLTRILTFGLERGFWRVGCLLGDCFGGVGTTGLVAAYMGLRCISVELESSANDPPGSPFVELAQDNIDLHRFRLEKLGCPLPVMLQGDSRQFARLVGECAAIVTSPPWADQEPSHGQGATFQPPHDTTRNLIDSTYGHTEGQIGSLPAGDLDGILTSPPYASQVVRPSGRETERPEDTSTPQGSLASGAHCFDAYGHTEGQIGALPAGDLDAVITSPPYEASLQSGSEESKRQLQTAMNANGRKGHGPTFGPSVGADYGHTEGQIGNEQSSTYWQAVSQVYQQCWLALKPGGVLAVVVKDYVRDKARVPLCDQTCMLLSGLGFEVFLRVHASLTETTQEPGLFGEPVVKTIKRASFFRRLAEKKGSPRIDFEVALFARKVGGGEGPLGACVTSPPWQESLPNSGADSAWIAEQMRNGKMKTTAQGKGIGKNTQSGTIHDYGHTPGQIGALPPGTPPASKEG